MRTLVMQALKNNAALNAVVPPSRIYQFGAMDGIPARPFIVVQFNVTTVTILKSGQPNITIRVHDERGSYVQIDDILVLVDDALRAALPMESDTARIVDVEWTGFSDDLVDDGYNTNVRTSSYTLTGRK